MDTRGLDVALEGGNEAVVGEGGDGFKIGAEDELCEKGGGGGADGATVAFEANVLHDALA